MKNFRQSIRFMWPYRGRIALGVLAAIGVSMLFTVSIGMLAPILHVMTSREGLDGWIYRSNVEKRLRIELAQPNDPTMSQSFQVPILLRIGSESPLRDRLRAGDRITAIDGRAVSDLRDFSRTLARTPDGRPVRLTVERPGAGQEVAVSAEFAMPATSVSRRALEWAVGLLPHEAPDATPQQRKAARLTALFYILLAVLAMTVARNFLRYANDLLVQGAVIRAVIMLQRNVYARLTRLPLGHFAGSGFNDAISRVNQDSREIGIGLNTLFGKTIQEPIKVVGFMGLAFLMQWQVALATVVSAPLAGLIVRKFGKRMRKSAKRALVSVARQLAVLEETLFGLRVVKGYTAEGYERKRFFGVQRQLLRERLRMLRIDSAVSPLLEVIGFVGMIAAIMLACNFVMGGTLELDLVVAQLGLLAAAADAVRKLSNVNNRLQQADAASERVFAILRSEPEPLGVHLPTVGPLVGEICFRGVWFRYPGTDADVLRDVTLRAPAGHVVAVVGPNGSGKTTLLSLLPRFFEPTGGSIAWDGQDIRGVNLRSLRRRIGLVTQDAVLFADTVEANIRYGNRRASREQVIAAARQAYADEFIAQMPEGYDTVIGEHGTTLSGGQKQRIALARAILRDPSVFILDEAMSQVDAESEMKIQKVLDTFLVGRTAFVIAHRFSTVRQADQIVVLDAGRIVGAGRHEDLLADCPLYRTLYQTQFRDITDVGRDAPADPDLQSEPAAHPVARSASPGNP